MLNIQSTVVTLCTTWFNITSALYFSHVVCLWLLHDSQNKDD